MSLRIVLIWTCLLAFPGMPASAAESGPHPDFPELQVLHRFVGNWSGEDSQGETSQSTTSWTLEGRFVKQEYKSTDGSSGLIMRGHAPSLGKYVMTLFDTNGTALMLTGDWDPARKRLTCQGDLGNGVNITVVSEFPDDETEKWMIAVRQGGNVVGEVSGTNRKKKDQDSKKPTVPAVD